MKVLTERGEAIGYTTHPPKVGYRATIRLYNSGGGWYPDDRIVGWAGALKNGETDLTMGATEKEQAMQAKLKLRAIELLDWFDNAVLGHRWHGLCCFVSDNSWWGDAQDEVKAANKNVLDNVEER